jgi:hypothetical protein
MTTMDPAVRDLLAAIRDALKGCADWRAVSVAVAATDTLNDGDAGAAADWLRGFLAQRAEAGQRQ